MFSTWFTGINESKKLTKHISCKRECKFYGGECNPNQKWNNEESQCECDDHNSCEKDYIWNPATCSCENGKYLRSVIDGLKITCDEVINTAKHLQPVLMKKDTL